ncbi:MAG: hypothetical protein JXA58_06280 [Dehalococcoidia bacterium]|nr:hypothetical protein [Dehalococcoidia bacterium]
MFGHDKNKEKDAATAKKLSPKDMMAQEMDALQSGKELEFRLGQIYVKPFITVVHNPEYPGKGKKFLAFQDGLGADGKPSGKRGKFWETDKSKEIAAWILEREGAIYHG